MIPVEKEHLLTGPVVVILGTVMADGQPQLTPVWCSYDGELIWVNTAEGRQKDRNLQANPKVTIAVLDPQNPYNWLEVRGEVVERTLEGAGEHINQLSKLYRGVDTYASNNPDQPETRVIFKIKPLKVNG